MTQTNLARTPEPPTAARSPRRRLPADARIAQILDAALQVFSDKGYAAARIEDIGAVAHLSKGGIYTHFRSKEEIFEALLKRLLGPAERQTRALPAGVPVTVDVLVERVVAPLYALLAERANVSTLRLLLADGARAPQMVARWRSAIVAPFDDEVRRLLRRGVAEGSLRDSVLTRAPHLLTSPGVQTLVDMMVQGPLTRRQLAKRQREHVALLRELLAGG